MINDSSTGRRDVRQAMADWFRTFPWDYWVSLTYDADTRIADFAAASHLRAFLREAASDLFHSHIRVVGVTGLQRRSVPHHHVLMQLLDNPDGLRTRDVAKELAMIWQRTDRRAGFIVCRDYDRDRGAAWYQSEHSGEWFVGDVCSQSAACRRRCPYRKTTL